MVPMHAVLHAKAHSASGKTSAGSAIIAIAIIVYRIEAIYQRKTARYLAGFKRETRPLSRVEASMKYWGWIFNPPCRQCGIYIYL